MHKRKRIGLVAHDARKKDLIEWVEYNAKRLSDHHLICTGTTGSLVEKAFKKKFPNLHVDMVKLKSGPLGGDQQIGSLIADGKIDILIFLIDPMTTQPHDVDIKALTRLCSVYNIILACTRSTADFIISSPLFDEDYVSEHLDYSEYLSRRV